MVSFVCEVCQDTVKKPKLDQHRSRCHGAYFTCVDCNTTFNGPAAYKSHTSCVSEAQRYQKALYKPTKKELKKQQQEVVSAPAVEAKKVVEEKEESKKRSHDEMETESAPAEKKSKESKKDKKEKKSESDIVATLSDLVGDESLSLHKLLKKLRKKEGKEEKDDEKFLKKIALRKEGDKLVVVKA
ncbi:hypothetical protein SAICODRAFT_33356 [Saitoella complicata NRRL Y-17804]|uniref:Zinc finger C2H2 LYAR-type domain-containing protein n=1 Tax=Saitoella complicata (strain BCRC 22490 / CBS 7301 / JCM 7358 / NBRC 10748 / NRRL Y-17804) TaxID=698492 RepID=A0A0E9NBH5_SAICN|nr:uncharacterized protein SAICODRAFT_33356 [Saitoella complicata NRRL Y-17804]ODQ55323.1 hypothetical protein SAICODRAFT_33356 [Saitoella complicata NRRL Y-17804]GAO47158.1 hypothetical protein G7K_1369-t1 [Saitoella complicata NRRL Y-17804]